MESPEFTEEIDFQKYWLVLRRRWFPATLVFGSVFTLAALATSLEKPIYEASAKLLFKEDRSSTLTGVQNELGDLKALGQKSDPLSTEAEIIRSLPIAQMTVDALDLKDEEGEPLNPKVISGGIEVKSVTGTDVLQISYQADNPSLAAAVVNKVMDVYMQEDIRNNRAKAAAVREFIGQQLPKIQNNVVTADKALRKFKEENRVVALPEEAKATVETLSDLDQQIAQAQAQLADATARSQALRDQVGMNSEVAVALSSVNQSPAVQEALKQLQEVQSQLAVERTRYQEGYPTIANLRRKEASLEALLQERAAQVVGSQQQAGVENFLQLGALRQQLTANFVQSEVERSGLANQLTVLKNVQSAYKTRSNVMPKLEQNLREFERRVSAAQSTYEMFLGKFQEAQVAENQNVGNARPISYATIPEQPAASKKKLILAGGGVAGILLAIATAFLLDLIDKSVKTVKEAKDLFRYTLLGVIPALPKAGKVRSLGDSESNVPKIYVRDLPHSPLNEAYQMLQANLKFLSSDKELKAIVVTSSVPKEGKSEVSANLAAAMVQVGRRVLLVDADMRHPSQHHIWKLTNSVGLSNLLVGEAEFKTAIQEVMPGLDVLTSGVIPPNPVALLDSKRMASLIESFSKKYDSVIIDTPSLVGVADAPILGKMTDGILLVVRPRVVNSASAKAAKEFLARSGQNVLGLVANGVSIKNEPDSYFYYTNERYTKPISANREEASIVVSRDLENSKTNAE